MLLLSVSCNPASITSCHDQLCVHIDLYQDWYFCYLVHLMHWSYYGWFWDLAQLFCIQNACGFPAFIVRNKSAHNQCSFASFLHLPQYSRHCLLLHRSNCYLYDREKESKENWLMSPFILALLYLLLHFPCTVEFLDGIIGTSDYQVLKGRPSFWAERVSTQECYVS